MGLPTFLASLLLLLHTLSPTSAGACNKVQTASLSSSAACLFAFQSSSVCPPACCCFKETGPASAGLGERFLFGAAGSCYIRRTKDASGDYAYTVSGFEPGAGSGNCHNVKKSRCGGEECEVEGGEAALRAAADGRKGSVQQGAAVEGEDGDGGGDGKVGIWVYIVGGLLGVAALVFGAWLFVFFNRRRKVARSSLQPPLDDYGTGGF